MSTHTSPNVFTSIILNYLHVNLLTFEFHKDLNQPFFNTNKTRGRLFCEKDKLALQ